MLKFCGQYRCMLDANGRVKLAGRFVEDFMLDAGEEVVLYCLPEGAIAIYPEYIYLQMRQPELQTVDRLSSSLIARRSMRRFGAMSVPAQITRQGRLTIPSEFREYAALAPGREIIAAGAEIGVELWNIERHTAELAAIAEYWSDKNKSEVDRDISGVKL